MKTFVRHGLTLTVLAMSICLSAFAYPAESKPSWQSEWERTVERINAEKNEIATRKGGAGHK